MGFVAIDLGLALVATGLAAWLRPWRALGSAGRPGPGSWCGR